MKKMMQCDAWIMRGFSKGHNFWLDYSFGLKFYKELCLEEFNVVSI